MKTVTASLENIRQRIAEAEIRFSRPRGSVALLAVSKTQPAEAVRAAFTAGQRAFGENQLRDALAKITATEDLPISWHFIGPVQSNKTRPIAAYFDWVHSIDRVRVAQRLNDQRPEPLPPLNVCLQLNVSGEKTKSGVSPEEAVALAEAVAPMRNLQLRGLMAIPEFCSDFDEQRAALRPLAEVFRTLQAEGFPLDTLSMGMTADLEAAIAEGATVVRVGTAIFGARRTRTQ